MKKAQSMLEYTVLIIIIIAAIITMQTYIKRGFQGRWKQAVDDLGEQYDVNSFTGQVRHTINSESTSTLTVVFEKQGGVNGASTYRNDSSFTIEKKTGRSSTKAAGL